MIEMHARRVGNNLAALSIDYEVTRLDSGFVQHAAHQGDFIFAVAVTVLENVRSRMWLISADSRLDGNIAHIMLKKTGNCRDFVFKARFAGHQLKGFAADLRRGVPTTSGEM